MPLSLLGRVEGLAANFLSVRLEKSGPAKRSIVSEPDCLRRAAFNCVLPGGRFAIALTGGPGGVIP